MILINGAKSNITNELIQSKFYELVKLIESLPNQKYAEFLDASKYYPDIFQRMIDKIQILIDNGNPSINMVLNQGYF